MKKRKFKLFASLTSLVLVVAVMAVGVWAASSATATISGTVGLTAVGNVNATIQAAEGTKSNVATATGLNTAAVSIATSANSGELALGTISLTATEGLASDAAISYSVVVTITNAWTEGQGGELNNLKVEATAITGVTLGFTSGDVLEPGENTTVTFTWTGTAGSSTLTQNPLGSAFTVTLTAVKAAA